LSLEFHADDDDERAAPLLPNVWLGGQGVFPDSCMGANKECELLDDSR
jgi:hypothetical protein